MGKNTSISLDSHFEEFITRIIDSGKFKSVNEVIQAALHLLEKQENEIRIVCEHEEVKDDSCINIQEVPWKNAVTHLRDHVSFEEIIKEQGQKKITFEEVTEIANAMDWEYSLEELLEVLD